MGPIKFLVWIAEKIREQAEAELHDDSRVRQAMSDLYRQLEAGEITEEDFGKREEELVQCLEAIAEEKRAERQEVDE